MPDLPKYGSVEKCPKCKHGWPSPGMVIFHDKGNGTWGSHSIREWAESKWQKTEFGPRIVRTCKRCGFSWDEAPLDAEKP